MKNEAVNPGVLYLVATPIGNLEDLTFRALRVLKEVDLVAAEDTRHSRKLFSHYGITTALTSYFAHNESVKGERILEMLRQGKSVALITDAGTPAISDPGFLLVRACRDEDLPVTAVPGASAVIAGLSVAGLPTERFAFEGFIPPKSTARRKLFKTLSAEKRTLVFYEAPHRLVACLADLMEELGDEREIAVVRELTKLHEEVFRGTASEALAHFAQGRVRGEIVLLVGPAPEEQQQETVQEALLRWRRDTDLPMRQIVKEVARQFGLPGSDVYKESLKLRDEDQA
ncbi:16S rRNA (2'-O-methyl-C1402)-methyltransferase [Syntrophotalea carbinolica DSM 2380]|uniref:Ribosomal RNA small subunit methyltransferase I n=1 Tax=Syntrophotalea carbinolica (strain DSM 2380 / NBRC 103641 / GraBd1) TaxID=338963 RepID=Q3A2F3_SYNC1|nr:16S rRNA (cytidine(1402)-2'-O)-methyltransferase [Syntrophotalea carbinolica]ABA89454.1 16S rRNA (2'-O-methyl-C1402)-methyltransferase [Syntrophotalea carbinolica DSM 2380]